MLKIMRAGVWQRTERTTCTLYFMFTIHLKLIQKTYLFVLVWEPSPLIGIIRGYWGGYLYRNKMGCSHMQTMCSLFRAHSVIYNQELCIERANHPSDPPLPRLCLLSLNFTSHSHCLVKCKQNVTIYENVL